MKKIDEIQRALKKAEQYARFAPGRLIPKEMAHDGQELYELTVGRSAWALFLFPQLSVQSRMVVTLLAGAKVKLQIEGPSKQLHDAQKQFWGMYSQLKIEKHLTPFQKRLVEILCKADADADRQDSNAT